MRYRTEAQLLNPTKKKWALYKSLARQIEEIVNKHGLTVIKTEYNIELFVKSIIFETNNVSEIDIYLFVESSYRRFDHKTILISDGDVIPVDQSQVKVLHTPGHYPDSCCFLLDNSLFTGDTVFIGRTGRTISAGSNVRKLYHSVYEKVLTLPQNITIFPGHDYGSKPYCSIGENIIISPLLQAGD